MKEVSKKEFYDFVGPLNVSLTVTPDCTTVYFVEKESGQRVAKTVDDQDDVTSYYIISEQAGLN